MKDKQPCGCVHDGRQWLTMCDTHRQETDALHAQARQDHESVVRETDWLALPVQTPPLVT